MEEFIAHIQRIKAKRKIDGKPVDFDSMLHIVSIIGGKYMRKGLIAQYEIDMIKYQGCGGFPYLGKMYKFWEDEEGEFEGYRVRIIDVLNEIAQNPNRKYKVLINNKWHIVEQNATVYVKKPQNINETGLWNINLNETVILSVDE